MLFVRVLYVEFTTATFNIFLNPFISGEVCCDMQNEQTHGHVPNQHTLQALLFFPCASGGIVIR